MEPSIDEPRALVEKQPLENERCDMVDTATSLYPALQTSSKQETWGIPPFSSRSSEKDPEKEPPQTTIENIYTDKTESENEADGDPDLVSG